MQLSPAAGQLLTLMTDPAADRPSPWPDHSQLSPFDLGTLLPIAYRTAGDGSAAGGARFMVEDTAKQRQPLFTPEACQDLFAALVDGLETRKWADLCVAAGALLRCPDGPPLTALADPARTLVRFLLRAGRTDHPYALLTIAGLGGLDNEVTRTLEKGRGPIAVDEIDLLRGWDVQRRALLLEVVQDRSYNSPTPLPDAWERLAALPDYVTFARTTLEAADARIAAIHAYELPFKADRAFDDAEKETIGRAVRLALLRDEPWLPDLLTRLLAGAAVAPTTAKTLPSQAVLYEVGRAAQEFPTPEVLVALRAASAVTRHKGVPKQLDRMIKRIERALADRVEVAFRMPDLGFDSSGRISVPLGDHTALITIGEDVELTWWLGDRQLKSIPSALRKDHADEVKRLRELVAQVRRQIVTLVRALEAGYTGEAVHPYAKWREDMATHPVAGTVANRLIWEIETSPGHWQTVLPDLHDAAGRSLAEPAPDAPVRLWHPARASLAEVTAWREMVTERRLRQPFKQAFREVYLLTPAEEQTRAYSNRFAAHIVDYQKLYALFKQRGWEAGFLGPWDGGDAGEARRVLAEGRWRASFFHDHLHDAGNYAATDQIRFHLNVDGEWREATLADVPPLVFSEAMRDVDLFVAVTSIAADPEWVDRGEDRHHDYWRQTSFGALPPSAEVRRDALARLLPRTALADRCILTDRFLVVRGDLRTYKIHLGSANILMDPGDVYLCIVSARKHDARLFLPFEEDGRLSLILSKAFLLADDKKITDETILQQIQRTAVPTQAGANL
ncbi:DUF4132 domain-containing protein [Planotetraspora mira]|uniref:DUF4132 domain-containing protein n=1 Tax=Planotetraspora mira TaxID=58121 RepID=A0A8J3TWA4_9ACTN|nr:DUF4132 domain-containing protein [Planotetraspora mira]GII34298.1 hypothetical protein Pmi06nite_77400 [Planotetraspora mira]